ncbi:MAG: spore coat protein [Clostridia bacterium]|nr:spore coat protein [Clostridia bacterium]
MANLTSKELTALEEQIGSEQVLVKKYEAMASMCSDTKIQQDLNNFASKHRAHYNTLITFLQ